LYIIGIGLREEAILPLLEHFVLAYDDTTTILDLFELKDGYEDELSKTKALRLGCRCKVAEDFNSQTSLKG
jgi:hypothetical protein